MSKLTVYLSGPISKIPGGNKQAFSYAQMLCEHAGYNVINPHDVCQEIREKDYATPRLFWRACMRANIKVLVDSEIILMLPGFSESEGATVELELAKRLGLSVKFYETFFTHLEHQGK